MILIEFIAGINRLVLNKITLGAARSMGRQSFLLAKKKKEEEEKKHFFFIKYNNNNNYYIII
jgi:hypothetical protein